MTRATFSFHLFVYGRLNAIEPFLTYTRFYQFAGAYMDSIHQDGIYSTISKTFADLTPKCLALSPNYKLILYNNNFTCK